MDVALGTTAPAQPWRVAAAHALQGMRTIGRVPQGALQTGYGPWMWTLVLLLMSCNRDPSAATACGVLGPDAESAGLERSGGAPQNLLMISVDTLRRDHVGQYATGADTPFLDTLLSESVVLEDFRACANWTLPGMVCGITGTSTLEMGLEPMIPDKNAESDFLDPEMETLATWLSAAGFRTTLVTAAKLFSHHRAETNGFQNEVFDDDATADWVVDQAIDQVRQGTGSWYLHLHFRDPHAPYAPPSAYQGDLAAADLSPYDPRTDAGILAIIGALPNASRRERRALQANLETLYRGEVKFVNDELSRLWQNLEAGGYLEDTLVVLWSDHGEQLLEHDDFQHGQSLHAEEGMALGAFWARGLTARRIEVPTSQVDLVPSILSALNVEIPAGVTGKVIGTAAADRVRISSAVDSDGASIHAAERNGLRLLYHWNGEHSLYDYRADPAEEEDISRRNKEDVACLWDFLKPALAQVDQAKAGGPPTDPD